MIYTPHDITESMEGARTCCDIISAALRFRLGLPGRSPDPPTCIYHSIRSTLENNIRQSDLVLLNAIYNITCDNPLNPSMETRRPEFGGQ